MKIIKNEQTEKDLYSALSYANIGSLPKKYDARSKKIWTKAIVQCAKSNGVMTYVICTNLDDEKMQVKKTFGSTAQIILDDVVIYPYEFLDMSSVPDKEDVEKFIERYSGKSKEELSILGTEEKIKILKETAINLQNSKKR